MKINILMISPQYYPLVGGYERACERLASELAKSGHRVLVCAERRSREWPRQQDRNGVGIQRWWCLFKPGLHSLSSLLGLAIFLLCRGRRFDVWHVHQYGSSAALAVLVGGILGRPVVLKLTSTSAMGIGPTLTRSRFSFLLKVLHRRVDAVIALTQEMAQEAEDFGIPRERIHLIGNGVDIASFSPQNDIQKSGIQQKLGLSGRKVLLYVGRLAGEKNLFNLLKAWAIVEPETSAGWCLVIVGDGPLHDDLVFTGRQLKIDSQLILAGKRDNIAEWLNASDIFILPSFHEGLSNTLLEAMASGLPVIVTPVSGSQKLVGESGAGLIVDAQNPEEIATAISTLIKSECQRKTMGAKARCIIEQKYSLECIANRCSFLYLALQSKRHPYIEQTGQ